jgi:hypothetical protein
MPEAADEPAATPTLAAAIARQAWPAALPGQMRAVADALATAGALDEPALADRFSGRGPWKKRLSSILATREALGRAWRDGALWQA